jgi:Arf-GAP/coiled-coil/ANK repeat/PH domain-containing protein
MIDNNPNSPVNIAGAVLGSIGGVIIIASLIFLYLESRSNREITDSPPFSSSYDPVSNPLVSEEVGNKSIQNIPVLQLPVETYSSVRNPLLNNLDNSNDNSPNDGLEEEQEESEQVFLEGIVKSGYLFKKSTSIRKDWLRRWFFIKNGKLYYVHKSNDILERKDIQAILVSNLLVSTVKEITPLQFQIISPGQRKAVTGGGIYELQADNESEMKSWVQVIRQQILGSLTDSNILLYSNGSNSNNTNLLNYYIVLTKDDLNKIHQISPRCADCGSLDPTWASMNLGILICIECSGIHRSLGTHISKVRSLTLDKWTPYSLQLLSEIGNTRFNSILESKNKSQIEQYKSSGEVTQPLREQFITDKYVKKRFLEDSLSTSQANELLLQSAKKGDLFGILYALINDANVHTTTSIEESLKPPLHLCCIGNFPLCVELLCLWNANVDDVDAMGRSPIDIAKERNLDEISQILNIYRNRLLSSSSQDN